MLIEKKLTLSRLLNKDFQLVKSGKFKEKNDKIIIDK